jgi:hypothetical protein
MNANEAIVQLFINEVDVTSEITGDLSDQDRGKSISFPEPPTQSPTLFAVMGREVQAGKVGSFLAKCVCDRPGSVWDGLELTADPNEWFSLFPRADGTYSPNWFMGFFSMTQPGTAASDLLYPIATSKCGAVDETKKVAPIQKRTVPEWVLRRTVEPSDICLGNEAPTTAEPTTR